MVGLSDIAHLDSVIYGWGPRLLRVVALYVIAKLLYNLHFHPLAKFPGPRLAAATSWWQTYLEVFQGESLSLTLLDLHAQYGTYFVIPLAYQ